MNLVVVDVFLQWFPSSRSFIIYTNSSHIVYLATWKPNTTHTHTKSEKKGSSSRVSINLKDCFLDNAHVCTHKWNQQTPEVATTKVSRLKIYSWFKTLPHTHTHPLYQNLYLEQCPNSVSMWYETVCMSDLTTDIFCLVYLGFRLPFCWCIMHYKIGVIILHIERVVRNRWIYSPNVTISIVFMAINPICEFNFGRAKYLTKIQLWWWLTHRLEQ